MKHAAVAVLLTLLACGDATPRAAAPAAKATAPAASSSAPSVARDEPPATSPCVGAALDVDALMAAKSCTVTWEDVLASRGVQPPVRVVDVAALEVRAEAPPRVAAGSMVTIDVSLKNGGAEPIKAWLLDVPPEVVVKNDHGETIDPPAGRPPVGPACGMGDPWFDALHLTIAPGGAAKMRVAWRASRVEWPREPQTTCEPMLFERREAGPLAPGRYTLRIAPRFAYAANAGAAEIAIDVAK